MADVYTREYQDTCTYTYTFTYYAIIHIHIRTYTYTYTHTYKRTAYKHTYNTNDARVHPNTHIIILIPHSSFLTHQSSCPPLPLCSGPSFLATSLERVRGWTISLLTHTALRHPFCLWILDFGRREKGNRGRVERGKGGKVERWKVERWKGGKAHTYGI